VMAAHEYRIGQFCSGRSWGTLSAYSSSRSSLISTWTSSRGNFREKGLLRRFPSPVG
jgi:hypothetical protein